MKPNIVIVQPPHIGFDSLIESFCEKLSETHYVYLIRPSSEFRDDSPAGVRFLHHSLDRLPGFADVESAIAIGDPEIAGILKKAYPTSRLATWDPHRDSDFPESYLSDMTVIAGDFGRNSGDRLARAM